MADSITIKVTFQTESLLSLLSLYNPYELYREDNCWGEKRGYKMTLKVWEFSSGKTFKLSEERLRRGLKALSDEELASILRGFPDQQTLDRLVQFSLFGRQKYLPDY